MLGLGLRPPGPRLQGFTLMELLVTLAIVAIVSAIAAPSFTGVIERQRVSSAADSLRSSIELARSEAIKRNANVAVVRVGGAWNQGWEVREGADVLQVAGAVPRLTISSAVASLSFNSSGRSTAAADFSVVPDSGNTAHASCVDVTLSGRPRVIKGSC